MKDVTKINNEINLKSPEYYFNRELSFLEFNERVLKEAEDNSHPLLERLKFIEIFSSNLDEFFMIRVAGLKRQIAAVIMELSYDGKTPMEQLTEIRRRLLPLYERQEKLLLNEILPLLDKEKIIIHKLEDTRYKIQDTRHKTQDRSQKKDNITDDEREFLKKYFCEKVLPVLTPLSLDPAHPFPRIINRSLNIAFVLTEKILDTRHKTQDKIENTETRIINDEGSFEKKVAFLPLPSILNRLVRLEREKGYHYILLEEIIKEFAGILFPGLEILESNTFRVTRDADIEIAEDEAEDLLFEIAEQVKHRRWGTAVVRLEVSENMPEYLVNLLMDSLDIEPIDVYRHKRPLSLPDFRELSGLDIRNLKDKPFSTRILSEFTADRESMFEAIKKNDIIVHHPYDSFTNSTLRFIRESSNDPDVLAIKITLYRTGLNSPIVAALKRAAENGKEVTAFVELKARFDEENNITWARELEQTGAHVIYGLMGLKTHCKICVIVRKEAGGKLRSYLHLSTGNYNHSTARLYTDIGFFTSCEQFRMDAIHLFNYLTGYSHYNDWKHFIVAPINLYDKIIELIERETDLHTPENPGMIFVKMNSLVHRNVIPALYRASQKGVKIKFLIRGLCCLKPDIPGISENIEIRSILGRFLEHSRIFYFKNGGNEEIYLSSADWMSRNLHNRVELMYPIYDEKLKKELLNILNIYWGDNSKSWRLKNNGGYEKINPQKGEESFSAQSYFLDMIKVKREK